MRRISWPLDHLELLGARVAGPRPESSNVVPVFGLLYYGRLQKVGTWM